MTRAWDSNVLSSEGVHTETSSVQIGDLCSSHLPRSDKVDFVSNITAMQILNYKCFWSQALLGKYSYRDPHSFCLSPCPSYRVGCCALFALAWDRLDRTSWEISVGNSWLNPMVILDVIWALLNSYDGNESSCTKPHIMSSTSDVEVCFHLWLHCPLSLKSYFALCVLKPMWLQAYPCFLETPIPTLMNRRVWMVGALLSEVFCWFSSGNFVSPLQNNQHILY